MGPALVFAAPGGAAATAGMVPVPMGGATGGRDQLLGSLTRRTHAEMDRPAGLSAAAATAVLDRPQPFTLSGLPAPTEEGGAPLCRGSGCRRRGPTGSSARRACARLAVRRAADRRRRALRAGVARTGRGRTSPGDPPGSTAFIRRAPGQGRGCGPHGRPADDPRRQGRGPATLPRQAEQGHQPRGCRRRRARLAPRDQPYQPGGADRLVNRRTRAGVGPQPGRVARPTDGRGRRRADRGRNRRRGVPQRPAGRRRLRGGAPGARRRPSPPCRRARQAVCGPTSPASRSTLDRRSGR